MNIPIVGVCLGLAIVDTSIGDMPVTSSAHFEIGMVPDYG